ncbi:MAG: hypothetical protein JSW50_14560, partial [Candidatus Latescibacterota bacterium]
MVRAIGLQVIVAAFLVVFGFVAGSARDARTEELSFVVTLTHNDVLINSQFGTSEVQISAPGYEYLADEGFPRLPYRIVNVLLPQGESVGSFDFEPSPPIPLERNARVKLASPMLSEDGEAGHGRALAGAGPQDNSYPGEAGRYLGTGYLHGRAIASFAVFPVRITTGDLVLSENIRLRIDTKPLAADDQGPQTRERYRKGFHEKVSDTLSRMVINPEVNLDYRFNEVRVKEKKGGFQPTSYPSLEGSPVDYLIITTDALASEFQRLADWKTEKGVPTVVRTIEFIEANTRNGVDLQETMRFFIQDAYAKWGITYVLLGGDSDVLPPRYALSRYYLRPQELPVDMYFACLDGSWNETHDKYWGEGFKLKPYDTPDLYAEIYNGRIPCSTGSEADLLIDKIIAYETPCDAAYLNRYIFFAEVLFPVNWPVEPMTLNGADIAEYVYTTCLQGTPTDVVRMYETDWLFPGSVPENKQAAMDSIEVGFNHANHIGHGFRYNMSVADASILNVDADAFTNGCRYTNLYMLNCTAAAFHFYCLAEHFLKNPNGGTVTVIGANDSAFPNAAGNYMYEYYDLLYNHDVTHIGEVYARSRLPRTPVAESGDNVDLWTHYVYTILADPEMPLYTGTAQTADVLHATNVGLGSNNILVNVTAGGQPVDSAHVCLSKGDDDYQYGATNSLGNVVFDFVAESPGDIKVVVTGLNLARYEGAITVD